MDRAGERLIATWDPKRRGLVIFEFDYYEEVEAKLIAMPTANRKARHCQRLFIGHATELDVDQSGDVFVPAPLIDVARVTDAATIERFERYWLWPSETPDQ